MEKRRIYVDSCVLMLAFKAEEPEVSDAAIALLDDADTAHLYSRITELEVMPKAVFNRRTEESTFYQDFFACATRVSCTEAVIDDALQLGMRNGLAAGDALHVACAISSGADELVTSEKRTRLPSAPDAGILIRTLRIS